MRRVPDYAAGNTRTATTAAGIFAATGTSRLRLVDTTGRVCGGVLVSAGTQQTDRPHQRHKYKNRLLHEEVTPLDDHADAPQQVLQTATKVTKA